MDANIETIPRRIHIIGAQGSGKTTLARELSTHLAVPHYELDWIAYNPACKDGAGLRIPLDKRLASLRAILEKPGWITEGVYLWWTNPLLEVADLIVWLDLPFPILAWRIVNRHVQRTIAGTNRQPGTARLIRVLRRVWKRQTARTALVPSAPDDDRAATRVAEAEILRAHENKVIRCIWPADVTRLKSQLLRAKTHLPRARLRPVQASFGKHMNCQVRAGQIHLGE